MQTKSLTAASICTICHFNLGNQNLEQYIQLNRQHSSLRPENVYTYLPIIDLLTV